LHQSREKAVSEQVEIEEIVPAISMALKRVSAAILIGYRSADRHPAPKEHSLSLASSARFQPEFAIKSEPETAASIPDAL
jgi:hypothetical protein